jgi:hypothetical protein
MRIAGDVFKLQPVARLEPVNTPCASYVGDPNSSVLLMALAFSVELSARLYQIARRCHLQRVKSDVL